jgi:hypothetical protein
MQLRGGVSASCSLLTHIPHPTGSRIGLRGTLRGGARSQSGAKSRAHGVILLLLCPSHWCGRGAGPICNTGPLELKPESPLGGPVAG